jgi:flavin reductase (DIM6/NTAB) family NADH-FMN oxidoreductase RutF
MPETDTTREVLRMFNYGLYVAAGIGSEGPHAATISWVSQASFEPRLISVAMRKGTAICNTVLDSRRFSLHVVGAEQNDFAKAFFKVNRATDDVIAGYHYTLSESGLPIFDAASAWLECAVTEVASLAGDHAVFIAQVTASGSRTPPITPLALKDTPWHYGG